jgi:uncharacterized protein (TIGR00255 family)
MISSMTGFARVAGTTDGVSWAWEMKSVNGRGLDIRVRTPPGRDALGEAGRKAAAARFGRGTININLSLQSDDAARAGTRIDRDALVALAATARQAAADLGLPPPTMDALLQLRGVVLTEAGDDALSEAAAHTITGAADQAASALAAARADEGRALEAVILQQLAAIAALAEAVERHPGRSPEAIRERLAAHVAALLGADKGFDPARLHQEAALLATRADVREELDRLKAHVEAARALFAAGGGIGRKLDFLAQEFGREASTLCAKANSVEISRLGLDLRTVVDQLREQAQNVE